jgi:hypothetical protein
MQVQWRNYAGALLLGLGFAGTVTVQAMRLSPKEASKEICFLKGAIKSISLQEAVQYRTVFLWKFPVYSGMIYTLDNSKNRASVLTWNVMAKDINSDFCKKSITTDGQTYSINLSDKTFTSFDGGSSWEEKKK